MTYKMLCLSIAFCTILVADGCARRGEHVLETWEATHDTIKVRVRKFDEKASWFLANSYFTLEAADKGSAEWHEVLAWQTDDNIPIQRQQVQFVSDQVVYAFANLKYAVTMDAGHTWSIWDARRNVTPFRIISIKEVRVSSDGSGTMVATSHGPPDLVQLSTADYGVHWATK